MALSLREAQALAKKLEDRLDARAARIRPWNAYYKGEHNLGFASERFKAAFGGLFKSFSDNWCEVVCDAPTERLEVLGFRIGDGAGGDVPQEADKQARDIWQRCGMDAESKVGHLEGSVKARFHTLVWADDPTSADPQPDISIEDATQMIVAYEPGSRRRRAAALKKWDGEDGWLYCTLYLADELWKFRRPAVQAAGIILPPGLTLHEWGPRFDDEAQVRIDNPLGKVPVVEFTNRRRLTDHPTPEHKTVMPLQDAVNKLIADMMVAAEAGAFPARWGTGIDLPKDPKTGQEIDDAELWKLSLSKLLRASNKDARFGNFDAADLRNFVAGVELLVTHIAAQTRTPPHYLLGKMANLSGEALAAAETGLVSKCHDKTVYYGESWEETMRLAFAVIDDKRADVYNAETIWADVEHVTDAARSDAAIKKKQAGVPWRQRMEDMGYTQTQIDRMEGWLEDDARREAMGLGLNEGLGAAAADTPPVDDPVAE